MMDDTDSTTSLDENTENYLDNPTRDTLTEGIMGLLKPTIDQLDERIRTTRICQSELKQKLEVLHDQIKSISDMQQTRHDFDPQLKKIVNCKHKLTVIANVLQSAQERIARVHANAVKKRATTKPLSNDDLQTPILETLATAHIDRERVYDPAEDTFLMLDALQSQMHDVKRAVFIAEIGCGSGAIIASLAKFLNVTTFAIDINVDACRATKQTCVLNKAPECEVINMDLLRGFRANIFDVVVFNPPYVVTESQEIYGMGIERSWAGGVNGREVIDRVLLDIDEYLSARGLFFLLLLNENKPHEVVEMMNGKGFGAVLVNERRIRGEYLKVFCFRRE